MTRDEIRDLLVELGRRLAQRGVSGELYIVGGAAIALAFDERRATRDIDAVFEPKAVIYAEAGAMATELDLPEGWLNDGVKGFLVGPDPEARVVLETPGLRCATASPRMLLALKVLAHRSGEDDDDLRLLAAALELDRASQILAVVEAVFPGRLDVAARFYVEELFPRT